MQRGKVPGSERTDIFVLLRYGTGALCAVSDLKVAVPSQASVREGAVP